MLLPTSHSRIVRENRGVIWLLVIPDAGGRYRRGSPGYARLRECCAEVKKVLRTPGFFTSDELPGYGFTRGDVSTILKAGCASPNDLVVCFAYERRFADRAAEIVIRFVHDDLLRDDHLDRAAYG